MIELKTTTWMLLPYILTLSFFLLDSERVVGVQKIRWAMNVASHVLAGFGRINDLTDVWSRSGPELVLNSLLRDCKTVRSS
jgi:hypothetical protein